MSNSAVKHSFDFRTHAQRRLVCGQAERVCRVYRNLNNGSIENVAIRKAVETWLAKFPQHKATRRQAAVHEAAHFISSEVEGMGAWKAAVWGSQFGRGGWGGNAVALNEPPIDSRYGKPKYWLRHARVSLVGLLAEALLADGDAFSSSGEFMEAHMLVCRAAQTSETNADELWLRTLRQVAQLVEQHAEEIEWIADLLMKRKVVTRWNRGMEKFLARVSKSPPDMGPLTARAEVLVGRLINSGVPSFSRRFHDDVE